MSRKLKELKTQIKYIRYSFSTSIIHNYMQGFKEFFSDMAFHMSQDPDGPSALEAIQDVFDINKTIKIIDLILGASKMILMLKPTLKSNLDILENIKLFPRPTNINNKTFGCIQNL
jgi:hypothetical protein